MKKQLYKVKQLADQTFLRTGKSEQLNDELQAADRRVDHFKEILSAVVKKLSTAGLMGQGQDPSLFEKRLKKCHEYQLGLAMQEYGSDSDDNILRYILYKIAAIEINLAKETADHDVKVEQIVSAPIQWLLENEIPNMLKVKRNLTKAISERDSVTSRFQTASKHAENQTKIDFLREEMEEADLKVDQANDYFAIELFSVLKKEPDVALNILQLVKLQKAYHESALHTLEEIIPELEKIIVNSNIKPMYGVELDEHLRVTNRQIAFPIELCVCILWEIGMNEEGLFRVPCGTLKLRRIKLSIDSQSFQLPLQPEYLDVHIIASALKSYLRDLPEPLLTFNLYNSWIRAGKLTSDTDRLDEIETLLSLLPKSHYENLRYLIKFFAAFAKNVPNKMTPQNIAIVIAPNFLWSSNDHFGLNNMSNATVINSIVETLISNVEYFFPGDLDIFVTLSRELLFKEIYIEQELNKSFSQEQLSAEMKRTASTNSLYEQSSPTKGGSPKPVIRRKNKPAPVPPIQEKKNGVQSQIQINKSREDVRLSSEKLNESTCDGDDVKATLQLKKDTTPVVKPRTVLLNQLNQSLNDLTAIDENMVILRKKRQSQQLVNGEKIKPVIPERPSIVRPSSFRIPRSHLDQNLNDLNEFMLLERTSLYNVAQKQQVQVQVQKKIDGHDTQLAEKEKFLMRSKPSVPVRPSPPRCITNGHVRTLSDGCMIDTNADDSNYDKIMSHSTIRMSSRPPRSQPPHPPPPPPPQSKNDAAATPGQLSDSNTVK